MNKKVIQILGYIALLGIFLLSIFYLPSLFDNFFYLQDNIAIKNEQLSSKQRELVREKQKVEDEESEIAQCVSDTNIQRELLKYVSHDINQDQVLAMILEIIEGSKEGNLDSELKLDNISFSKNESDDINILSLNIRIDCDPSFINEQLFTKIERFIRKIENYDKQYFVIRDFNFNLSDRPDGVEISISLKLDLFYINAEDFVIIQEDDEINDINVERKTVSNLSFYSQKY